MRRILLTLICSVWLAWPMTLSAQTPIANPSGFTFDQPDFTATYVDQAGATQPIVVSFAADYFAGGAQPIQSTPFAKILAVLQAGATYKVLFSALPSYPIGAILTLKIRAIGPGGTSTSASAPESFNKPVPVPATPINPHVVQ